MQKQAQPKWFFFPRGTGEKKEKPKLFFLSGRIKWLGIPKVWEKPADEATFEKQIQKSDFIVATELQEYGLAVQSQSIVVQIPRYSRSSYGTGTSRQRPHDSGSPSRNPKQSSEHKKFGEAVRHQSQTVAKWKQRPDVQDAPMGPKQAHSTVLSTEEEALIVAFRKHTLLPLDDCLYGLQETIPHLTRASLHRCLQRHGISRLPDVSDKPTKKSRFKAYPIGYFHLDIAEVQTEECKLYMFVAIDRTSKFAFAELHERMTRQVAADFLRRLIAAVPYQIHTILTDNGIQFAHRPTDRYAFPLLFDRICAQHGIEHRLTNLNHPWTNGQVERMNRTLKAATVSRYYYDTHEQLREHLTTFLTAYNFAKRLKTLNALTPYEYICQQWQRQPECFLSDPSHLTLGLNS